MFEEKVSVFIKVDLSMEVYFKGIFLFYFGILVVFFIVIGFIMRIFFVVWSF